ncbi:MAG: AAA family ATPase [Cyanobacteria bacterium REEB444]|nr:AAA family ATPase [Cyanobacteria bacterium REEB444]
MKIEYLAISNWRSIKSLEIAFQDLMIFIGQNNHGKSNVLSALLFFFGEFKPQDLDFNRGAQDLFVEITFGDLDQTDKTTFKKYLTADGSIRVRKFAYVGGNFEYRGYIQNPVEEWLREANASTLSKREVAESYPFHPFLPATGRLTKQDIVDAQTKYIEQNPGAIAFNLEIEETNFLGLKSVAKGIFGDIYFIPAVKDSTDDFSSKEASAFGKLYSSIIESMSANNPDWKDTKAKLSSLFSTLNRLNDDGQDNPHRPEELVNFEKALSAELNSWGAEIDVEVIPPNIDDIFRSNTQVWINDGVRTDIRRKGHGLQRALTFALIKVISDNLKAERAKATLEPAATRTASASTYFILEEPELYLHPQAQRELFDSLVSLSESKNQVVMCTHASALIDVERYKSICIVKKDSDVVGTQVYQCTDDIFTGDKKKEFNLSYWINPDRSELFFAKRVLLVEGPTDKTLIPLLAKRLGVFRFDHTLVDCGSKDNIPLYCQLLNKFRIPYIAIYDKDHQAAKGDDGKASADKSNGLIEAAIDNRIGTSVVFVNDIEEEVGMIAGKKNKPFDALRHIAAPSFTIAADLAAKITSMFQ